MKSSEMEKGLYENEREKTLYFRAASEAIGQMGSRASAITDVRAAYPNLWVEPIGNISYEEWIIPTQNDDSPYIQLHRDDEIGVTYYLLLMSEDAKTRYRANIDFRTLAAQNYKDFNPLSNYLIAYTVDAQCDLDRFKTNDDLRPEDWLIPTTLGLIPLSTIVSEKLVKPSELKELVCYQRGIVENLSSHVLAWFEDDLAVAGYLNKVDEDDSSGKVQFAYTPVAYYSAIIQNVEQLRVDVNALRDEVAAKMSTAASRYFEVNSLTVEEILDSVRNSLQGDYQATAIMLSSAGGDALTIPGSTKLFRGTKRVKSNRATIQTNLNSLRDTFNIFQRFSINKKSSIDYTIQTTGGSIFENIHCIEISNGSEIEYEILLTADQILALEALSLAKAARETGDVQMVHHQNRSIFVFPTLNGYSVLDKQAKTGNVFKIS